MNARKLIEDEVLRWVGDIDPSELLRYVKEQVDVSAEIERSMNLEPWMIRMGKAMIGRQGQEELRNMTDADLDSLLRRIMRTYGNKGLIIWQSKSWFFQQVYRIRDRFLAA